MNVAHSRILRRAGLAASLGFSALVLSGCSIDNEVLRFGWPSGVTPEAHQMRELWTWSVIAALVMGVIVWGLTFWTVAFHRKKADSPDFPRQTGYNVPLELSYTAAPFVIIAVLFYFTVLVQNDVNTNDRDPAVVVDVTAFQWNWKFGYRSTPTEPDLSDQGAEKVLDDAAAEAAERTNEEGHPRPGSVHGKDPYDLSYLRYDKIETIGSSEEIPVLVLPTNRVIEFHIASADVIHAFWVPEFLFKRDVNPNPEQNHSENVFQITEIERTGAFVGRCAEMCGTFHSMMNFEVRAIEPEMFDKYVEYRMSGLSNAMSLTKLGEENPECGELCSPTATTTYPFSAKRDLKSVVVRDDN
ncbi:cytochrome c oxidase subunit II [Antrihabitans sp. YC2-6]|uniref:aa3-type cytochrome oxidase subunit II n=1 Tax=Antrihabitans sp. YC2-6 TaxID=2799498 RepID=UPI0018F49259|nr:cytochrome c oxidase subunit II [Antrihabitans sp. YC2-6]MBJ8343256.1 cytochrome c oxidase subunit II [Antrihabitans sp. YC2-6]